MPGGAGEQGQRCSAAAFLAALPRCITLFWVFPTTLGLYSLIFVCPCSSSVKCNSFHFLSLASGTQWMVQAGSEGASSIGSRIVLLDSVLLDFALMDLLVLANVLYWSVNLHGLDNLKV